MLHNHPFSYSKCHFYFNVLAKQHPCPGENILKEDEAPTLKDAYRGSPETSETRTTIYKRVMKYQGKYFKSGTKPYSYDGKLSMAQLIFLDSLFDTHIHTSLLSIIVCFSPKINT